jgi:TolA-binding protein
LSANIRKLGFVLVLLLAAPALTQDEQPDNQPPPRLHPDVVFADALGFDREWYDLAYQVLDAFEASGRARPEDLDAAHLHRADLLVREAGSMKDRAKAGERVEQARKLYTELSGKGGATGTEASLRIGQIYLTEGEGAFNRMKSTEDAEARAAARKEAEDKYKEAEKFFGDLVEKYKDAEKPDDVYKLMISRFNRAVAVYQLSQIGEKGKERDDRLQKAHDYFLEVNTEHSDQPKGYEAAIYLGFVCKDQGKSKESIDAFTSACGLKDFFYNKEEGKYYFPDEAYSDIVARAYLCKAQTLNEMKEYAQAVETAKKLFDVLPGYMHKPLGLWTRIEDGKARIGAGDAKKGFEVLQAVANEDPKGPLGEMAKATMSGKVGGSRGAAVPPERRLANAKAGIDRGKTTEGMNDLRYLIADLEVAGGDDAKLLPTCWYELGNAYLQQKRWDEAAAAFDALATLFTQDAHAPKALFLESMSIGAVQAVKTTKFDGARYDDTLRKLSSGYPNDPTAKAAAFLLGNKLFEARDYPGAAREFEKVAESAGEYYDAALYQVGVAYTMEGRRLAGEAKDTAQAKIVFASARSAFEKAIKWADGAVGQGKVPAEGERAANLKKLACRARCRLAEIMLNPAVKDPAKALDAAQAAEAGLGQNADPEMLAEARLLVVQAYLASADAAKAEEAQAKLAEGAPDSQRTARGEREVAIELDRQAEKGRSAKPTPMSPDDVKGLLARAADHYARWIAVATKAELPVPPQDYVKAGDRLYSIALELNALPETASFADVDDLAKLPAAARFAQAATGYEATLAAGSSPDTWLTKLKLSACYGFTRNWEKCGAAFEPLVASEKLLKAEGKDDAGKMVYSIDPAAVKDKRSALLFGYADFGRALFEMAAKDRKYLDNALEVLARVVAAAPPDTQLWWRSKYDYFAVLYERGDYQEATIGIRAMSRTNPNYDGGKYGLKAKFEALAKKLEGKQPPGK